MSTEGTKCCDCEAAMPIGSSEVRCSACRTKRTILLGQLGKAVGRDSASKNRSGGGFSGSRSQRELSASHFMMSGAESDEICTNCRERNAQVDSPYCLKCRLTLHKSLGDAAQSTDTRRTGKRTKPEDRMKNVTVKNALSEKRRRTGMHRFDPSPKLRKGYR